MKTLPVIITLLFSINCFSQNGITRNFKQGDTLLSTYGMMLYHQINKPIFVPAGEFLVFVKDSSAENIVFYNNHYGSLSSTCCISKKKGLRMLPALKEKRKQDSLDVIRIKQEEMDAAKRKKQDQINAAKHKNLIIQLYGQANADKIFAHKIWLGMTQEMTLESWGKPGDINRSVGSWGVDEQWVYGDTYLYFENGVLSSWQD
jgi:hypothetical protein